MRAAARADVQSGLLITPGDQLDAGHTSTQRPTAAHIAARREGVPVAGRPALRPVQCGVDDRGGGLAVCWALVGPRHRRDRLQRPIFGPAAPPVVADTHWRESL